LQRIREKYFQSKTKSKRGIKKEDISLPYFAPEASSYLAANSTSPQPARKSELLALVAGGIIPENIA
jgi:hypothetical protein